MTEATDTPPKAPTPPYISFQSLKTLTGDMREHGLPNRIDRTVLTNFSGAVGGQIITALKFLGLTNDEGYPTEKMVALVEAYGTDTWPSVLEDAVRNAYEPLFQIKLETASPKEFNDRFRDIYPGTDEVQRKCITFFLNAVREAQIKISPYIMKNKKPRSKPAKRRTKAEKPEAKPGGGGLSPANNEQVNKPVSQVVFEAFDPVNMPPEVQQATLTLLTYLKTAGK